MGTKGEKKYKSKIIVNDIKIDFSINLIQKALNYTKNLNKPPDMKMIRPKTVETKKDNNKTNIVGKQLVKKKLPERKKTIEEQKSKIPILKKAVKAITMAKQIRSVSCTTRKKKPDTAYKPPPKVVEKHEDSKKENTNIFSFFKKSLIKKDDIKKNDIKRDVTKKQEKGSKKPQVRVKFSTNFGQGKNKILTQMISVEKKAPKKLKTVKIEEFFLEPISYDKYLSDNIQKNKKGNPRETFCEGFFIASFPHKDGQIVEKSQSFPSPCGHEECSALPAMKPEIIFRYPLEDTKTLELNNLAATICFPTGIKVCYSENEPEIIKDYVTPITNQKGERYYMVTYHFYLKLSNDLYTKNYEMHPLKQHLMKFADNYLNVEEEEMDKEITEQIQQDLEKAQNLGFRDNVFVPYCICLISKYPFITEMKKSLESIYNLIIINNENLKDTKEKNKINYLIMHLINSIPIPDIESRVQFYIPYFNKGLELKCPKLSDLKIMNSTLSDLLKIFTIDYIVNIFRFLIFEKKILFIDEDYTRLTKVLYLYYIHFNGVILIFQ